MGGPQPHNVPQHPPYGQTNPLMPYPYDQPPTDNQPLPFLATLDFLDLSRLADDPIMHSPW